MTHRKESNGSDINRVYEELESLMPQSNIGESEKKFWTRYKEESYPFSKVLRLRVLQVVCGILIGVMGSVACIEEKGDITNLGLGIFAGIAIVVASGSCIHTSRGFTGYRQPSGSCNPNSVFRFFGPTVHIASVQTFFWLIATILNITLLIHSMVTLHKYPETVSETSYLLAIVQGSLSILILVTVVVIARVDCKYDPD